MDLGTQIKAARFSVGVKQKDLAASINLSSNYMSLVENNKRMPSVGVLERIEKAVSLPPGSLMSATASDKGAEFDMMASLVRTVELNKEMIITLESAVALLTAKVGNLETEAK